MTPVFRFAPSPNGRLHLGHAYAAMRDYDLCRRAGGRFLLRIEDIDPERSRPQFEAAILDDLAWLGLVWEEPVMRQSERMDAYRAALDRLRELGLLYPAFMSRKEIAEATAGPGWPRDPDGAPHYPPRDRDLPAAEVEHRLAEGARPALRLRMDRAVAEAGDLHWIEGGADSNGTDERRTADPAAWGDVILARRDVPTSYHLAVVVDDAYQGVTHVVRGRDLLHATSVHVLLQHLLGLPRPHYHHHRLIVDATGAKLSKSARDTTLADLRADGATPAEIRDMVGL